MYCLLSFNRENDKSSLLFIKIFCALFFSQGTKAIEGLALKWQSTNELHVNTKAFKKMKKLRLLQLDHVHVVGDYEYLSKNLRRVCWQGFPLKHMPDNLYQENVISIELKCSTISQVWKKSQVNTT